jgi:uncharacterized membrane protein
MSHMQADYENTNVQMYTEPERTSVMAILSLVLGILGCCTLVTAPVGVLLGIFGLFGISRSKGRVGGSGLAIGGVIVSILAMAIWLGIVFGFGGMLKMFVTQFGGTTETVLTEIQNGDYDAARAELASPAADMSDAEFAAFHAAYTADLGSFVGLPSGLGELFSGYGAVGPQIQAYNGRPGYIPMPVRFDSGWVLVMYVMDPSAQSGSQGSVPRPDKLILIGSDGTEYTLPADAGDKTSANRPDAVLGGGDLPAGGAEDQTPTDENADDSGDAGGEEPDGP